MNKQNLNRLLEYLPEVLDKARQKEIEELSVASLNWKPVSRLPVVFSYPLPPDFPFQPYPHSEIFDCPEKMLYNELVSAFSLSIAARGRINDDLPWTVRANFGTVVIASMFGAKVEQVAENPPWVVHDPDHEIRLEEILDHDPLDISRGWGMKIIERYQFYQSLLKDYPKLKDAIQIVLPDLQGPFDNLELVRGSRVFEDICIEPELVTKCLESMATAQISLARQLQQYLHDGPAGFSHQHGVAVKGNILLRNDSVIMLSPDMYREIVASHDERILKKMGGGGIHSCGNITGHVEAFMELPSLRCIDIGQPELNDIDHIYNIAQQRKIPLLRINGTAEELTSGKILKRFPTGASLHCHSGSLEEASKLMDSYIRTNQ